MSCNKRDKHTKMNNLHQFCFYFKILFKSENWVQSIDLIKRDHRHFSHSITGTAEPVCEFVDENARNSLPRHDWPSKKHRRRLKGLFVSMSFISSYCNEMCEN